MRKKNQVSPEMPPQAAIAGWQVKDDVPVEEPMESFRTNQVEQSIERDTNTTADVVPVNHETSTDSGTSGSTRRFKRYSRAWSGSRASRTGLSGETHSDRLVSEALEEKNDGAITSVPEESDDPSQALLQYFLSLSLSEDDVDFIHMENLLANGADVNSKEESRGATIMHEVAEHWDTTVAQFLYERGANIHCTDNSGKTPLHVAASTNHSDMVVWLIKQGADLKTQTTIEQQTPVHYAARNDSVLALDALIQHGGDYEARDYKGRTPLHLAAELDRTVVAEFLLSLETPAKCTVSDDMGNHVITSMIRTMPETAVQSLNQLHKLAPADRKQFYMLSNLEHQPGDNHAAKGIKSPFEMAVEEGRYEVLTHTVMEELIKQKWKRCVRWYFYMYLGLYFLFLASWSILISYPSLQLKHIYVFPTDIWRILLELIAVGTYIHQIVEEVLEIIRSNLSHKKYTNFRKRTLQDDLDNTDVSLPEERKYLTSELERTNKSPPNYFKDPWNVLDIVTYVVLLLVIVLHVVDIAAHTTEIAIWTARFSCVASLLIWVRLLKLVRALRALGPLVAIISELIADILRYFALYLVFFIPYMLSVWVLFGGDQSVSVQGNEDLTLFYRVAVLMFRMSLIDSFPYEAMRTIDEVMTVILVITFLIITAVVGLNLFIALLSDTFQRVYDNAQANALLQQARLILQLEDKVSRCTYQRYLVHIQNHCNPYSCYYDDDDDSGQRPGQLQKITHQIHDIVTELQNDRKEDDDRRQSGLVSLRNKLEEQDVKLSHLALQVEEVKSILLSLQQPQQSVRSQPSLENLDTDTSEQSQPVALVTDRLEGQQQSSVHHPHAPIDDTGNHIAQVPLLRRVFRPSSSQTQVRLRKLTPIVQPPPKQQLSRHDTHSRSGSIPNLHLCMERVNPDSVSVVRSSSSPWVIDTQCSISEASLRSTATPSHRRAHRRK